MPITTITIIVIVRDMAAIKNSPGSNIKGKMVSLSIFFEVVLLNLEGNKS